MMPWPPRPPPDDPAAMTARIRLPAIPSCPTIDMLVGAIERGEISFSDADSLNFVNYGPDEPKQDFRDLPWIKTDTNHNPLGTFTYSGISGKWLRDWGQPIGAIVTVYRAAVSVSADRENKGLMEGWELADGTGVSGLNLTENKGFFTGAPVAWDIYSVVFIGYPD